MKFNGMTQIELEMLKDEIQKALPGTLLLVPAFVEVTKKNFDELKKQGFNDGQAMYMSVQAAAKQMGIG